MPRNLCTRESAARSCVEHFQWEACQSTFNVNVPLTIARLSVAGWGPWLKALTSSSQAPQWWERHRQQEGREEWREKGSAKIILIKRQGSSEVDLPFPPAPWVDNTLIGGKGSLSVAKGTLRSLPGQSRQCANYCQLLACGWDADIISTLNKTEGPANTPADVIQQQHHTLWAHKFKIS